MLAEFCWRFWLKFEERQARLSSELWWGNGWGQRCFKWITYVVVLFSFGLFLNFLWFFSSQFHFDYFLSFGIIWASVESVGIRRNLLESAKNPSTSWQIQPYPFKLFQIPGRNPLNPLKIRSKSVKILKEAWWCRGPHGGGTIRESVGSRSIGCTILYSFWFKVNWVIYVSTCGSNQPFPLDWNVLRVWFARGILSSTLNVWRLVSCGCLAICWFLCFALWNCVAFSLGQVFR